MREEIRQPIAQKEDPTQVAKDYLEKLFKKRERIDREPDAGLHPSDIVAAIEQNSKGRGMSLPNLDEPDDKKLTEYLTGFKHWTDKLSQEKDVLRTLYNSDGTPCEESYFKLGVINMSPLSVDVHGHSGEGRAFDAYWKDVPGTTHKGWVLREDLKLISDGYDALKKEKGEKTE